MLCWVHEKSRAEINPPHGHTGPSSCFGSTNSGRMARPEDRSPAAGFRRATSRLDRPGSGLSPHEPESLGSSGKCPGSRRLKACAQTRAPVAVNPGSLQGAGKRPGKVSPSCGAEPCAVGRPHAGDLLEAEMGCNPEGSTGAVLDASVGLSDETRQLQLSASPCPRGPQVPARPKKNSGAWVGVRRWFFRTRPGSACIPVWDEAGPNAANDCALRPPVVIIPG